MTDRQAIFSATLLRALATGLMGVLLGLYLDQLAYTPAEIGIVIGAGLAGAALSATIVTFLGDRLGRRRSLLVLALAGEKVTDLFSPATLARNNNVAREPRCHGWQEWFYRITRITSSNGATTAR